MVVNGYNKSNELSGKTQKVASTNLNNGGKKYGRCEGEAIFRRSYVEHFGTCKEYVVCVPIDDHNMSSTTPILQQGVLMVMRAYDPTETLFPLCRDIILYKRPVEAQYARPIMVECNRDGSPIFQGYVFGDIIKLVELPVEDMEQWLDNDVASSLKSRL